MKHTALIAVLSLWVLVGCASTSGGSVAPTAEPFMLVQSDGKLYRLNKTTGETWLVTGERMQRVAQSASPLLETGRKYFIERNRSMTYLGDGKFSDPVADYSALWN
jgi:hypothetical protein